MAVDAVTEIRCRVLCPALLPYFVLFSLYHVVSAIGLKNRLKETPIKKKKENGLKNICSKKKKKKNG